MIRPSTVCGYVSVAVLLFMGFGGCAPLVTMEEPSPHGPRISHLRFVPAETRAGCPVSARFQLEAAADDVVSTRCAWVRRHGRSAEQGRSTLPVEWSPQRDDPTEELEARFTPADSGTYYYYVQVGDRAGRLSNVLRATLSVDPSWTNSAPPCPTAGP